MLCILITFLVFQFDISGIDFKEEQSKNNPLISIILEVSHFDISGKEINLSQQ